MYVNLFISLHFVHINKKKINENNTTKNKSNNNWSAQKKYHTQNWK